MKAMETSLIHQEKEEEEKEAHIFAGKEVWIRADPVPRFLPPFKSRNSSSLMEMGCREVKMRRKEKSKEKETPREGTRKPEKETAREGARVPHRPIIKVERKEKSASHRRIAQRRKRKKEEVKASRRGGVTKKRGGKEGERREDTRT